MEVRTMYVAFPETACEGIFKTEEECYKYEQALTPKMWDDKGRPTLNGEEAMFVSVKEHMMSLLFEKYGKWNFPGLEEEEENDGYGYFYWDDYDEQFHYLDEGTMKRVQEFMRVQNLTSCSSQEK